MKSRLFLLHLLFIVIFVFSLCVEAQSTRRKSVKPLKSYETPAPSGEIVVKNVNDTIYDPETIRRMVSWSDYKKAVTSRVESLLLTNITASDTILCLDLDINYTTRKGKQLNRRTASFEAVVPPGETRHSSVQSWDKQQLFYHISTPPSRPTQRTTAFKINIVPKRLIIKH